MSTDLLARGISDVKRLLLFHAEVSFDTVDDPGGEIPLLGLEIGYVGNKRQVTRTSFRELDDLENGGEPIPSPEERVAAFRVLAEVAERLPYILDSMWFRYNDRWRVPVLDVVFSGGRLVFRDLAGHKNEKSLELWEVARNTAIKQLRARIAAEIGM